MATTNVAITDLDLFNNSIFTAIIKIQKNRQRAEINAIFKEIIKNDHYKDMDKDVLQQQINMLITEEKILNKINRNKNSYKVNESKVDISMLDEVESPNLPFDFTFDTPPSSFAKQPINDSITLPIASLNINTPQEGTLDNKINKNYINDTEDINYKHFKDNVLQDIRKDVEDMINRKTKSVEKTSEASTESCSLNYLEQINILKSELNYKNLIINKLLETVDKFNN